MPKARTIKTVASTMQNLPAPIAALANQYGGLSPAWSLGIGAGAGLLATFRELAENRGEELRQFIEEHKEEFVEAIVNSPEFITVASNPRVPKSVTILLNRHIMDGLNDFQRTYTTTHEIGHALGLAHTEECGHTNNSIMNQGSATDGVLQRNFNTPLNFDKAELKQLYN